MKLMLMAGLAGAGYLVYKHVKIGDSDFQSMSTTTPEGAPAKVATPVPEQVTTEQVTHGPVQRRPLPPTRHYPVPTTVPGQGVYYAPPKTITHVQGKILQPAPIVITQHGAASIAVGTVKNVQHSLNTLGYKDEQNNSLLEDGKLGKHTIAAIQAFQSKNRLVINGNADGPTKAALSATLTHTAGGSSITGKIIQKSKPETGVVTTLTGAVVNTQAALNVGPQAIQQILNILGASPPLKEDGKMGPKTIAAIKTFQTVHGLTPDGVAGPKTKTALYLASTATSGLPPQFADVTHLITMPEIKITA